MDASTAHKKAIDLAGNGGADGVCTRPKIKRAATHAHPLVADFIDHLNAQHLTWGEIAARCAFQVSAETMRSWRARHDPKLSTFDMVLHSVGLRLAIVPIEPADEAHGMAR